MERRSSSVLQSVTGIKKIRTARCDAEPQVLRWFLEIEIARLRFLAFRPQIWFEINGFFGVPRLRFLALSQNGQAEVLNGGDS